jgi:hypothetical protein
MQTIFRGGMDSSRPRTAMDCITNTHDDVLRRTRGSNRKKRLVCHLVRLWWQVQSYAASGKERQSLDVATNTPRTNTTFADNVRASLTRRGYPDIQGCNDNIGIIQARRRGYSDSKQILPLHIKVPPTTSLCELDGRFENPRKAPLPQGLKYNTVHNRDVQFGNPSQSAGLWSSGTCWASIVDYRWNRILRSITSINLLPPKIRPRKGNANTTESLVKAKFKYWKSLSSYAALRITTRYKRTILRL